MNHMLLTIALASVLAMFLPGCKSDTEQPEKGEGTTTAGKKATPDTHAHADGSTHADHGNAGAKAKDSGHAHDEVSLGTATLGGMKVELAQGEGKVIAGKQGHLVVKLPYNDKGATIVRAWIGTADRLDSFVGKGEYAASHDDYDVHAAAPDPLPEGAMWWIEIEKPDGTKAIGSIKPLVD